MSDNKDKPQSQIISTDGFHAFGNLLDNTDEPIKHKKKQLLVRYYKKSVVKDLGEGVKSYIAITAHTTQYDVTVKAILSFTDFNLTHTVANAMIRAKLSEKGLHVDNIDLIDAGESKEAWIAQLKQRGFKMAMDNDGWVDVHRMFLGQGRKDYHFCDTDLKVGDRAVLGWYGEPEKNKYIEFTSISKGRLDSTQWNFRYLTGDEVDHAGENKDGE
jgi:hypothetical protein